LLLRDPGVLAGHHISLVEHVLGHVGEPFNLLAQESCRSRLAGSRVVDMAGTTPQRT
jgi:hypothetical protein